VFVVFLQGVPAQHVEHIVRLIVLPLHVIDRLTFWQDLSKLNRYVELVQRIRQLSDNAERSSTDGRFVLFHLLAVVFAE
jgi:hypothetical protein